MGVVTWWIVVFVVQCIVFPMSVSVCSSLLIYKTLMILSSFFRSFFYIYFYDNIVFLVILFFCSSQFVKNTHDILVYEFHVYGAVSLFACHFQTGILVTRHVA